MSRGFEQCDRCYFKAHVTSADAPEYVEAVESTLCPRCREDVAEEMKREGDR